MGNAGAVACFNASGNKSLEAILDPDDLELFLSMNLSHRDIRNFVRHFQRVDLDAGGSIDVVELLTVVDVERTRFTERIFRIFDQDSSGRISLREFVLSLWNYCTLGEASLDLFTFDLYDNDGSGLLSSAEIHQLMLDIYGNRGHLNPHAAFIGKELLSLENKRDFNIEAFQQFAHRHPNLLFPAFNLQNQLRRQIMGLRFWHQASERRVELSKGKYVAMSELMKVHLSEALYLKVLSTGAVATTATAAAATTIGGGLNGDWQKVNKLKKDARVLLESTGTTHGRAVTDGSHFRTNRAVEPPPVEELSAVPADAPAPLPVRVVLPANSNSSSSNVKNSNRTSNNNDNNSNRSSNRSNNDNNNNSKPPEKPRSRQPSPAPTTGRSRSPSPGGGRQIATTSATTSTTTTAAAVAASPVAAATATAQRVVRPNSAPRPSTVGSTSRDYLRHQQMDSAVAAANAVFGGSSATTTTTTTARTTTATAAGKDSNNSSNTPPRPHSAPRPRSDGAHTSISTVAKIHRGLKSAQAAKKDVEVSHSHHQRSSTTAAAAAAAEEQRSRRKHRSMDEMDPPQQQHGAGATGIACVVNKHSHHNNNNSINSNSINNNINNNINSNGKDHKQPGGHWNIVDTPLFSAVTTFLVDEGPTSHFGEASRIRSNVTTL